MKGVKFLSKTVDDILIPMPEPRRRRRRPPVRSRSGRGFMKFLLGLSLLLVVLGVIFSFVDIGGNIILGYAQNYLAENLGLTLNAESISGNPVKGYRLNNFELFDNEGQKLLSAGFLSGRVNFKALLTGNVRLAEIALGGMSMDVDTLIKTVQNFKLPETQPETSNKFTITATPAYADTENAMPDIPLDRFSLRESVVWGSDRQRNRRGLAEL